MKKFILVLVFILATVSSSFGQEWYNCNYFYQDVNSHLFTHNNRLYALSHDWGAYNLYRIDKGEFATLIKTFNFGIYADDKAKAISYKDTIFITLGTTYGSGGIIKYNLQTDTVKYIDTVVGYNSGEKELVIFKDELYISGYDYLRSSNGDLISTKGLCKYRDGKIIPLLSQDIIFSKQQSYTLHNIDSNYLFISLLINEDNYLKDYNGTSWLCNNIILYNGNQFLSYSDNLGENAQVCGIAYFNNKLFVSKRNNNILSRFAVSEINYNGLTFVKFNFNDSQIQIDPYNIFVYRDNLFLSNHLDGYTCFYPYNNIVINNGYYVNYNLDLNKGLRQWYIHLDTLFINGYYNEDYYGNTKRGILYLTSLDSSATYIKEKLPKQPFYISNNTVNFPQNLLGFEYKVYDLCGKLVLQDKLRNTNTELSLERGMYVLFINDKYKKFLIN